MTLQQVTSFIRLMNEKWIVEFSVFVDSVCTQEDDPRNDTKPNQKTSVSHFRNTTLVKGISELSLRIQTALFGGRIESPDALVRALHFV